MQIIEYFEPGKRIRKKRIEFQRIAERAIRIRVKQITGSRSNKPFKIKTLATVVIDVREMDAVVSNVFEGPIEHE